MSFRKAAIVCGLMALLLSGCGIAKKPRAGSPHLTSSPGFFGKYDDQRSTRATCLRLHHVPFHEFFTSTKVHGVPQRLQAIQITGQKNGATIILYPEAEVAEGQVIMGQAVGAELIGSALLYPHATYGSELTKVENCTAKGVG